MFVICLVIADMIPSNKPQLQISANQLNLKDDHDMGWIIPKLRRYKWHADQIVQTFNKHYILFSFYVTNIGFYETDEYIALSNIFKLKSKLLPKPLLLYIQEIKNRRMRW